MICYLIIRCVRVFNPEIMQREDNSSQDELRRIIDGVYEYIDERQRQESTSNQTNGKIRSFYRCSALTLKTSPYVTY